MSSIKIPSEVIPIVVDFAVDEFKKWLERRRAGATVEEDRDEFRKALLIRLEASGEVQAPDELDEAGRNSV